jgi:hypothetical protein
MNVCNFFRDIYNVYIINIIHWFFPVEMTIELKNDYDDLKHNFINKINKIHYNKCKLFNYGCVYQTSNTSYDCNNLNIAYAPDTIQAIYLELENHEDYDDKYELVINYDFLRKNLKKDFINSILAFSTENSVLETLLYYYLKCHLKNFDIITSVELKIDDIKHKVDYKDTLKNIYDNLEKIIN